VPKKEIGTITQPDGATVSVKIVQEQGSQDVVTVGGRSWSRRLGGHLALPAEDAVPFADLADVPGHAALAQHIRNSAATITTTAPTADEDVEPRTDRLATFRKMILLRTSLTCLATRSI
jgi:hypothetical protein